jgi:hypothetical protein
VIEPELDLPDTSEDPPREAIQLAFADPEAEIGGFVWLELRGPQGEREALASAALFAGGKAVAHAAGRATPGTARDWDAGAPGGVRVTTKSSLEEWTLAIAGEQTSAELRIRALSAPLEGVQRIRRGRWRGGDREELWSYDQICRFDGTVTVGGQSRPVHGTGVRGRVLRLDPQGGRVRAAWTFPQRGPMLGFRGALPSGTRGHEAELVAGFALTDPQEGSVVRHEAAGPDARGRAASPDGEDDVTTGAAADPRLSITFGGDGLPRRAAFEIWVTEEGEPPWRAEGSRIAGTSVPVGGDRLDVALLELDGEDTGMACVSILQADG